MATYTAKIIDRTNPLASAASAVPVINFEPMRWVLDEVGRARVRIPKDSTVYSAVDLLEKELQIFRDGTLKWWGPMLVGNLDSGGLDIVIDVPELSWYLTRRQISDARANLLSNPGFDTDLTGWTNVGASTDTASSTRSVLGAKSLKLVQTAAGVDTYEYQQVAVTGTSIGTLLTLVAWVYIDDSTWGGPAFEARGLFVAGIESGTVKDYRYAEIDDATPRNQWVRLEVTVWVPPNKTWTIEARLYAPDADVWWDAVQLVAMESLSQYATDLGTIAGNVVDFVQNTTHGWDDLGITTSDVSSGVLLDRHYQYADHIDADDALSELVGMGLDWSMEIDDSPVVRQFTSYYPKGTDRSSGGGLVTFAMRDGSTGNLSRYRLTKDGAATATRQTVLGDGDGPDREEGYARDTSSLGGLTLGDVINAPPGSPISALQPTAEKRLVTSKKLVRILDVRGIPGDAALIDTVVVGDTVAVNIVDKGETISGAWRVVAKTLEPDNDVPTFILNEAA